MHNFIKILFLFQFYVIILLNRNSLLVLGQGEKHVFRMSDKLIRCSSNLSKVIQEFCDNMHKVVKRDTSVIIGKNFFLMIYTIL